LFRFRTKQELILEQDSGRRFNLTDPDQERAAYHAACMILLEGTADRRVEFFEELGHRLGTESTGPRLTMTWDDVRDLVRRYPRIEIGCHTQNHVDLPGHEGG